MTLLPQAHSHLSGLVLGMRLLCLLSRCHGGAGARTRHHVLAQWEMGLHRRALCVAALRPQEVCCQGDLERPAPRRRVSNSTAARPEHHCVRWCFDRTSRWRHRSGFSLVHFCVSGFHYVAAVFLQLCQGTAVVSKRHKVWLHQTFRCWRVKAETTSAVLQTLTFCIDMPTVQVFESKTFCTRCINLNSCSNRSSITPDRCNVANMWSFINWQAVWCFDLPGECNYNW